MYDNGPYEKGHIERIKKKKVVRRLARRCFVGYCKQCIDDNSNSGEGLQGLYTTRWSQEVGHNDWQRRKGGEGEGRSTTLTREKRGA